MMSDLLKHHMQLIESAYSEQPLAEGYEDRVAQAANQVIAHYHDRPVAKDQLLYFITQLAEKLPLGSLKPSEFVKDVIKHLGDQIKIKKKTPAASARNLAFKALKDLIPALAYAAESELGNIFPDGDPHDVGYTIAHNYKSRLQEIMYDLGAYGNYQDWFFDTMWPKIQQEFKKQHGGKDMYAELASWWDSQRADLVHDAEHQGIDPQEYLDSHGYGHRNPYK